MKAIYDKRKYSIEPKVIRTTRSTSKSNNSKSCKRVTFKETMFSSFKKNTIKLHPKKKQKKKILKRNEKEYFFEEKKKFTVFDRKINLKKLKDSFKSDLSVSIVNVNENLLLSQNDDKKDNFSNLKKYENIKTENFKKPSLNYMKKGIVLKINNLIKNKKNNNKEITYKKSFLKYMVKNEGLKKKILERKKNVIKNSFLLNNKKFFNTKNSLKKDFIEKKYNILEKKINKSLSYKNLTKKLSSKKF